MAKQYGPWATMIDLGGSPQLSTFWRRRLTMLAFASQTSFSLSRRNLLWLGAAALLLMALPTVHFAAAGEDGKTGESNAPSTAKEPGTQPSQTKEPAAEKPKSNSYSGSIVMFGSATVSGNDFYLPVLAYSALNSDGTRKELGLTGNQEKRLRDISRAYSEWQMQAGKEMQKAMESPSPEKRAAALREHEARSLQQRRLIRREVERLLTAQQLKELKAIAIGRRGVARLLYDPQLDEEISFSERQREELSARVLRDDAAKTAERRLNEALKKNREKTLAVIAPKQWDQIGAIVAENDFQCPSPELSELSDPAVGRQLGLTAQQEAKVSAIFAASMARTEELARLVNKINGPFPAKERAATDADLQRKVREMRKYDRMQIDAILTRQQAVLFKKLVVQQEFLQLLLSPEFFLGNEGDGKSGILNRIHATPEQKEELRRLVEEADKLALRYTRERGVAAMMILSSEQQDKLIDALDRPAEPVAGQTPAGKQGKLMKVGVGMVTLRGSDAKNTAKSGEGPKPPPRITAPKIDAAAAGAEAIKLYDADHDGKLNGEELDKCPGLKAAVDKIDPSGKGEITAEKIAARINAWQDSMLARMALVCRVTHNGEPLVGAEVKFVPEKFLGKNLKTATGKTDANGMAMIAKNKVICRRASPPVSIASRSPRPARRFPPSTIRKRFWTRDRG